MGLNSYEAGRTRSPILRERILQGARFETI